MDKKSSVKSIKLKVKFNKNSDENLDSALEKVVRMKHKVAEKMSPELHKSKGGGYQLRRINK